MHVRVVPTSLQAKKEHTRIHIHTYTCTLCTHKSAHTHTYTTDRQIRRQTDKQTDRQTDLGSNSIKKVRLLCRQARADKQSECMYVRMHE